MVKRATFSWSMLGCALFPAMETSSLLLLAVVEGNGLWLKKKKKKSENPDSLELKCTLS